MRSSVSRNNLAMPVSMEVESIMRSERVLQRSFFAVSALIFAASTAGTIAWGTSMSAMGDMPMPGGWTMSMAWMPMCGQTWTAAAASFLGMWLLMMVAMMSPSFAPVLWRYREALCQAGALQWSALTALAGVGYFFMWTMFGVATFAIGALAASLELQWPVLARAVPVAAGGAVLGGGVLQFTRWKAHYLACCRAVPGRGQALPVSANTALRYGMRHGLHCGYCCAGLTAILLVFGLMNLAAMALVTVVITAERLAPKGEQVARLAGVVACGVGLWLITQTIRNPSGL
jgi:predicted metal-binding membrane protein